MRFTLTSSALNSRLLSLSRVINSKNSLPILSCFLFQIKENLLTITASDGENVMKSSVELTESDGDGEFAVQCQTILDAVKELPEQPLTLNVNLDEHLIYLTYQNGSYHFPVQSAEEYPREQELSADASSFVIDASLLASNISRSLFATAQDELRPVMNGIYFDLKTDGLSIVATDGHKLVRNNILSLQSDTPASFILPKKPATLLKNVLPQTEGEVTMQFDSKQAVVRFADGYLSCRLIEGRYPNYNAVIPMSNPNLATIDRKSFVGAIRRVLPFSSVSSQLVRFHFDNGNLKLSAEDIDFSTNAVENVVCSYTGSPLVIGFKGSSMLEVVNNLDCDDIVIQMADPSRPGVIVPATQPDNQEVLMLIMPMMLND